MRNEKCLPINIFLALNVLCQFVFEEFSSETVGIGSDFLGCSTGHQLSATIASVGPHVNDMISTFDDFHVVLDDEDGVALCYQGIKGVEESLDVVEVQSCGGLVED